MSACVIVSTPYQAINIAQILAMRPAWSHGAVDLYVCRGFRGWATIAKGLSDLFDFRDAYTFEDWQRVGSGPLRQAECALSSLFPKQYMKSRIRPLSGKARNRGLRNYETIVMGWYNLFPLSMVAANPTARIVMFDEGTGSYHDDGRSIVVKRKRLHAIFGKEFPACKPDLLYLNCPEMADPRFSDIVTEIVRDESRLQEMQERMFPEADIATYFDSETVYFTRQNEKAEESKLEQDILGLVSSVSRTICRVHPWDSGTRELSGIEYDYSDTPWEIVCRGGICDRHCLVGRFSTAMFTPKLLYGHEPRLFFTFPLFLNCEGDERYRNQLTLVEKLRDVYSNPERIVLVETIDSLKTVSGQLNSKTA